MTDPLTARLPDDIERLVRELLELADERKLRLATAESCTGGLISSILTDIEGLSHAFERGFACYSDEAKTDMLGVPRATIEEEGAVSRAVALAMAKGALARSAADIGLAVTGYAGSAGADGEPGLVHFACARRGSDPRCREEHFGDVGRGPVREAATRIALEMLLDAARQG